MGSKRIKKLINETTKKRKQEENLDTRKKIKRNTRGRKDKNEEECLEIVSSSNSIHDSESIDDSVGCEDESMDLLSAVRKGLRETSQLPLGDRSTHRPIGSLVKLFYDGDGVWYNGRVLVYNPFTKLHFVYFEVDGTTEWIDITPSSEDTVLIVDEYVNHKNWPAQKFIGSDKGLKVVCKSSTGVYTEYFPHTKTAVPQYAIAKEADLKPLASNWPQKANPKSALSCQFARDAMLEMARIRQVVQDECKKCMMGSAKGYDWIGTKVRTSSLSLAPPKAITSSEGQYTNCDVEDTEEVLSVKCFGTIVDYCPGINEYFVVFEDECIAPKWISMDVAAGEDGPADVEVILDWAFETMERFEDEDQPKKPDRRRKSKSRSQRRSEVSIKSEKNIDEGKEKKEEPVCGLCKRGTVMDIHNVVTCSVCQSQHYHQHCMPMAKMQLSENQDWRCWHCTCCQGCGTSSWTAPIETTSLKEVLGLSSAPNVSAGFCRRCIEAYRKGNDGYCQICYRFYGLQEGNQDVHPLSSVAASANLVHAEIDTEEDRMVQCNECHRWVHSMCEGIDQAQFESMTNGTHPVWGVEYLCPACRVQVPLSTIQALQREDKTKLFLEPVTVEVAKTYFDVIRNPMDLSTMRSRASAGKYKSLQALREDFELMCLNAVTFNKPGDEYWLEAKAFFNRGMKVIEGLNRSTHMTAYGMEYAEKVKHPKAGKNSKSVTAALPRRPAPAVQKSRKPTVRLVEVEDFSKNIPVAVVSTENIISTGEDKGIVTRKRSGATATSTCIVDSNADPHERQNREDPSHDSTIGKEKIQELPKHPASLPGPRSAIVFEEQLLAVDLAMFSCCNDVCAMCASSGSPQYFIFCSDCGECFHSFCVDAPFALMKTHAQHALASCAENDVLPAQTALERWKCLNCVRACVACEKLKPNLPTLLCSICENVYHVRCVSPSPVESLRSWVCPECIPAQCVSCRTVRTQNLMGLSLDRLVGSRYFKQYNKIWGLEDKCLRCICKELYLAHDDPLHRLIQLNVECDVCNNSCVDDLISCRQCISCFQYVHKTCCNYDDNSDFDTDTVCGEYICPTCTMSELAYTSTLGNCINDTELAEVLKQVAVIKRNQLQAWYSRERVEYRNPLSNSFSYTHLAVVIWAAERYVNLYQSPVIPFFKCHIIQKIEGSMAETYKRHKLRARQFLRMCRPNVTSTAEQNEARLVSLLEGGMYAADNVERMPSAFGTLCRMAASFIAVTDIEWRSIDKQGGSELCAKSFYYRFPPDRAVELVVNEILGESLSDSHSKSKAMQMIHETLESLLNNSHSKISSVLEEKPRAAPLVYGIDASACQKGFHGRLLTTSYESCLWDSIASRRDWVTKQQLKKPKAKTSKLKKKSSSQGCVADIKESDINSGNGQTIGIVEKTPNVNDGKHTSACAVTGQVSNAVTADSKSEGMEVTTGSSDQISRSVVESVSVGNGVNMSGVSAADSKSEGMEVVTGSSDQISRSVVESVSVGNGVDMSGVSAADSKSEGVEVMTGSSDQISRSVVESVSVENGVNMSGVSAADSKSEGLVVTGSSDQISRSVVESVSVGNGVDMSGVSAADSNNGNFAEKDYHALVLNGCSNGEMCTVSVVDQSGPEKTISDLGAGSVPSGVMSGTPLSVPPQTAKSIVQNSESCSNVIDDKVPLAESSKSESKNADGIGKSSNNAGGASGVSEAAVKPKRRRTAKSARTSVPTSHSQTVNKSVPQSNPRRLAEKFLPILDYSVNTRIRDEELRFTREVPKLESLFHTSCRTVHDPTMLYYCSGGWMLSPSREATTLCETEISSCVQWRPVAICLFCKDGHEDSTVGRLLPMPSGTRWAHVNCLRVSRGVRETSEGYLEGVEEAILRYSDVICTHCNVAGASIACERRGCENRFHFRCALACDCGFKELKQTTESDKSDECSVLWRTKVVVNCNVHKKTEPIKYRRDLDCVRNPLRCLRVENEDVKSRAYPEKWNNTVQALKSGGVALRIGTLTIHRLGTLSFETPGHHTVDYIYPVGFRSTRIFWSMKVPNRRTLYTFEIQSNEYDETNQFQKLLYPVPRFVVAASDQPGEYMSSRSIGELYDRIITAVWKCNSAGPHLAYDITSNSSLTLSRSLFGHSAQHFFGVGVDIVRYAIEILPETLATIVPMCFFSSYPLCHMIPQYKPRFHIPQKPQLQEVLRRRTQHRLVTRKNLLGSCRAEGYISNKRQILGRRVRNLAKAIGDGSGAIRRSGKASFPGDTEDDDDVLENARKKSRLESKYKELATTYVIDPTAKLSVRRSDIHGWGLFATSEFPKDSMVVEYIGEKIRQAVADMREEQYEREGLGSCYLFRQDKLNIIDATRTGGMARFINHCCQPNAYARVISTSKVIPDSDPSELVMSRYPTNVEDFTSLDDPDTIEDKHIVIFAARTIHPGEEITYDYKFPIEETKLRCFCGAPRCQGTMN